MSRFLIVSVIATGIAATTGITLGLIAGYFGRWVSTVIMRFIDVPCRPQPLSTSHCASNHNDGLAILAEAPLSFLDVGIGQPFAGWDGMIILAVTSLHQADLFFCPRSFHHPGGVRF